MIPHLRKQLNERFTPEKYAALLTQAEQQCGARVDYRIAETPVFFPLTLLEEMARSGSDLTKALMDNPAYLAAAHKAIPKGFHVARETSHPNFLTADFALVADPASEGQASEGQASRGQASRDQPHPLVPRLVEIQAFPSVFAYQDELSGAYRSVYGLPDTLGSYLSGLDHVAYWDLLKRTIIGRHAPENVVLTEIDPMHQKTFPDFQVTASRLGIAIVDIRSLEPVGDKLHYRDAAGRLVPIHRIYNRAIADDLIARGVRLPFDLERPWNVEWAGHPNWYFLISKFSIPWLCQPPGSHPVVPPAAFVSDFLDGHGRKMLEAAGVPLPTGNAPETVYDRLLLKPLFSFAGKGIEFEPTQARLEAIPPESRGEFLLQQRMRFEPTVETPHGLTQAEVRILYLWPDDGVLTPALSLVRLGRGKMMGVDHNKNQEWVGASAAFFPFPAK